MDNLKKHFKEVGATNLTEYDWNREIIWKKDLNTHHDLTLTPDGNILTITKEVHEYKGRKVEFDVIVELSLEGNEISRWSTYENLDYLRNFHRPSKLDTPSTFIHQEPMVASRFGGHYDYYHLNSIQALPETPIGKKDKRFQRGNWLISLHHFDLIAILDKETKGIVWHWGPGEIQGQHMPRMLDNGNILIYDNGVLRRYSRVIELDPAGKKIVWEYKATPPETFFSYDMGSAQRLPNGNTLIAESRNGRVFEITKKGIIIWEWFNPDIDEEGRRKIIRRMLRIPKEKIDKLLNKK